MTALGTSGFTASSTWTASVRSLPGLEPTAATVLPGPNPEVTVSYVLKRPWFPGFPWSVTFRTDPPGAPVPPMVLVAHPRAVPLSVDDGQIVAHFPAGRDGARLPDPYVCQISPSMAFASSPTPTSNRSLIVPIRLRHPETGATRV